MSPRHGRSDGESEWQCTLLMLQPQCTRQAGHTQALQGMQPGSAPSWSAPRTVTLSRLPRSTAARVSTVAATRAALCRSRQGVKKHG